MNPPKVTLGCVSNVFIRMMHFVQEGDVEQGHTHPFDHTTLLAKGSLEATVNGNVTVFRAPVMIFIKKDKVHSYKALENDTLAFCIHAVRDGSRVEDIIDPASIPNGIDLNQIAASVVNG